MATERQATVAARQTAAAAFIAEFPRMVNSWRSSIDLAAIEELGIIGLTPELVAPSMRFDLLTDAMTIEADDLLRSGVAAGARLAPRFAGVTLAPQPGYLELAIERYVGDRGAALVSLIDDGARAGLQQSIAGLLRGDLEAGEAALKIGRQAGFTARNVVSINNFEAGLAEAFVFGDEVLTDAALLQIDHRVAAYEERILRQRGTLIASTETQFALNAGEREYWAASLDADGSLITRQDVQKLWHIVGSDVCEICLSIPVVPVGFDEFFVSAAGWMGLHAPAHPLCKCYVEYRVI